MPIIKVSQRDLDKNHPMEAGWRLCTLKGTREEISSKKDSVNYRLDFEVEYNEDTREFTHTFNSKALGMCEDFIQAITNAPMSPDKEYELAEFIGCKVYAEFSKEIFKNPANPNDPGRPINKIVNWQSEENPPF